MSDIAPVRGLLDTAGQLLLPIIVLIASLAMVAPAVADAPDPDAPPSAPEIPASAPEYFQDPAFKAAFRAEWQRIVELNQERASAEGQQEVADSATAYQDQSAAAALETVREEQPEFVLEPAWDPLAMSEAPEAEVEHYLGTSAALIDIPGEASDGLIESTLPLRARTDSAALSPVDLSVVPEESGYEVKNPLVDVQLPDDATEAVSLPGIEVGITPAGAQPSGAELVKDTVFYPNAAGTDTDYLAKPLPGGVDLAYTLRSMDSPESFSLDLNLPEGAILADGGDGSATIVDGGQQIAHIPQPLAVDADGLPVPLSWSVADDQLTIQIDHRADQYAYPILLDPALYDDQLFTAGFPDWSFISNYSSGFAHSAGQGGIGYGLEMSGPAWTYYLNGALANWEFNAPGTRSYIYNVNFGNVVARGAYNNTSGLPFNWLTEGIYKYPDANYGGGWEIGYSNNPNAVNEYSPDGYASPYVTGGYIGGRTTGHCLGGYCGSMLHDDNSMILQMFVYPPYGYYPDASGGYSPDQFWTYMGGATAEIGDVEKPTVQVVQHKVNGVVVSQPSGWYDNDTLSVITQARDLGLGVKSFKLIVPQQTAKTRTRSCSGSSGSRCTSTGYVRSDAAGVSGNAFSYSTTTMPEGVNRVDANATDVVLNTSTNTSWNVRVDRSAPVIDLSGPLEDAVNGGAPLGDASYRLDIVATDGSAASLLQQRSGVREIYVSVDGETQHTPPEQSCPEGNCELRDSFTFETGDYVPGQHTLTVTAMDQLGHTSEQSLTFTTSRAFTTDSQKPDVILTADPPSNGSYQLHIDATDLGSGMGHVDLYVDDVLIQEYDQPCPSGGCELHKTRTMNASSQDLAVHEVVAIARDVGGNTAFDSKGDRDPWNGYFGYNDDFAIPLQPTPSAEHLTRITKARDGKAEVIRFPIDWCQLADDGTSTPSPENTNPENWNWGLYSGVFETIANINGQTLQDRNQAALKVVPVLLDAPPWATGGDPCGPPDPETPNIITPPLPTNEPHWGTFAREFASKFGAPKYGIIGIELWNEPNEKRFWGVDPQTQVFNAEPDRFSRLVNRAATEINGTQFGSQILVLPGAVSPLGKLPVSFLYDALRYDAPEEGAVPGGDPIDDINGYIRPESIEAISFHLYANRAPKDDKALRTVRLNFNHFLKQFEVLGLANHPKWITEIGFPTNPNSDLGGPKVNGTRQCRRLRDSFQLLKGPVDMFVVHRLMDVPPADEDENYGVLRIDNVERPAYDMMAWLTSDQGSRPNCN